MNDTTELEDGWKFGDFDFTDNNLMNLQSADQRENYLEKIDSALTIHQALWESYQKDIEFGKTRSADLENQIFLENNDTQKKDLENKLGLTRLAQRFAEESFIDNVIVTVELVRKRDLIVNHIII